MTSEEFADKIDQLMQQSYLFMKWASNENREKALAIKRELIDEFQDLKEVERINGFHCKLDSCPVYSACKCCKACDDMKCIHRCVKNIKKKKCQYQMKG